MLEIDIPGFGKLKLEHAIFDFNGTLALDGRLIKGIETNLNKLAETLTLHVVTGDSFGTAKAELAKIKCKYSILAPENQAISKRNYIRKINPKTTVAIGNGRNDQLLLQEAALGIVIIGKEGAAVESILAAKIVMPEIASAIELLLNSKRLTATLRS